MSKSYCTQNGGKCWSCPLVNYGRDCQNQKIKIDFVEFIRGGCCRIMETGIAFSRADELEPQIEQFNRENSSGAYYRGLIVS